AVQVELGIVVGARHLGGAIPGFPRCPRAAAGRRRLCRIPAARSRPQRRRLQAQPPHRAEADGTVVSADFTLRRYRAEDEDAAIGLWRLTWQQAYPSIDFTARVPCWRERWRN